MRNPRPAMVVLIVANFMDLMDTTVVNVALPSIQADLRASAAAVEWLVAAYTLGLAATLVTGGRLGDLVGIRRVFLVGVVGFTAASMTATIAGGAEVLVLARALQGMFAGLMVPQVLAGVQALYPPESRAPVFGLVGFITGTASVVGPVLSGLLIDADAFGIGWRSIFVINVPVGIGLIIAAARWVPATRSMTAVRLDLPGVGFATAGVLGIVFGLIEGREHGWAWWTVLPLLAGPALLVVFVAWQRRVERTGGTPVLRIGLFADRGFSSGAVINFCLQAGLVGFFLVVTVHLQQTLGFDALHSGLVWLGLSVGALAGSAMAPRLVSSFGPIVMAVGALSFAVSMIIVVGTVAVPVIDGGLSWWRPAVLLIVGGVGMGLVIVPLFDVALATVPSVDAGAASGALSTIQQIGGSLGIAVIGGVFFATSPGGARGDAVDGLWRAVAGCVVALLLVGVAALRVHRMHRGSRSPVTTG
ncbi:drug resistance transporter, EmrB/QacA subfamily [Microlunatus soli]|uniref:Drug resistance transporter, EmrB/QacA subfamily n=2 Tax=Microlunatus soli TaxID=630515 RepID=A0A1H1RZW8_9ACTN|nr:drug resistance transporter, EmrB/QacA subfamily [Microlunatus soli]